MCKKEQGLISLLSKLLRQFTSASKYNQLISLSEAFSWWQENRTSPYWSMVTPELYSQNLTFPSILRSPPTNGYSLQTIVVTVNKYKSICEKYFLRDITSCSVEFSPTSSFNSLTENMCCHFEKKSEKYLREILFQNGDKSDTGLLPGRGLAHY